MKIPRRQLFAVALMMVCSINANAQSNFQKLDSWLADNTRDMGGRSILVVYKDGKVIYNHSVTDMNAGQKMANRFVARKQGKTADFSDYTLSTRVPIAS